jgi:hypothetical protein
MKMPSGLRPFRGHLLVLALLLLIAGTSYGFALWQEAQAENEYRTIIYNMVKGMGKTAGCMD